MLRQRAVIIYECSVSIDICSDELLNNKQKGKIWDLIIDKILAATGANFNPLSPVCFMLAYQSVAKSIAPLSEPGFNIQRHFILHHFLKTLTCMVPLQYIVPSLLSVKYTTVGFDIFQTHCCVHPYRNPSASSAVLFILMQRPVWSFALFSHYLYAAAHSALLSSA